MNKADICWAENNCVSFWSDKWTCGCTHSHSCNCKIDKSQSPSFFRCYIRPLSHARNRRGCIMFPWIPLVPRVLFDVLRFLSSQGKIRKETDCSQTGLLSGLQLRAWSWGRTRRHQQPSLIYIIYSLAAKAQGLETYPLTDWKWKVEKTNPN